MGVESERIASGELLGAVLAGKYRVERIIGAGGMGQVVEATHLELDERVALKFLLADGVDDPEILARFKREARLAVKIKSEHVARVIDIGALENGAPFIVMELLHGRDLSQVQRERRRFPVTEAVDHLLQAMEALAEAHALGIIHRDLKPQNLFLTHRKDGSDCIKVLDFGISKLMPSGDAVEAEGSLTHTTSTLGSPLFMSPEQMTKPKAVDARADIWSLGATLYKLVTGKPPFNGESVAQVCGMILIGGPPPPITSLVPEAPPAIDEVISRCLARDADDRYANIGDLAAALAPLGSPAAAASMERVIRVLQSAGFAPNARVPEPPPSGKLSQSSKAVGAQSWPSAGSQSSPAVMSQSAPAVGAQSSPAVGSQSAPSMSSPSLSISVAGSSAGARAPESPGDRTNNVWEHAASATSPPGKKRPVLIAVAAVGLLAIGAAGAMLVGRGSSDPAAAGEVTGTTTAATTAPVPEITPSATATATATATVTATSGAPAGKGPAKGLSTGKVGVGGPNKGKPKEDLFDERL